MPVVQSETPKTGTSRTCRIRATAQCLGSETPAAVLELSDKAMQIYVRSDIGAEVGYPIAVRTDELGMLSGEVAWKRLPYIGIDVSRSSNTAAKVTSFFKGSK